MRRFRFSVLGAVLALALAAGAATAEEGMWTFDNFPAARMRESMGWAPDQAWLDRVMPATARLPGCSAAVVSEAGLLLTNHHCVIACVSALSSPERNFIADGFFARARADERRCPGMSIDVLEGVADVTSRIDAAVAGASPGDFVARRDAEIARLEQECATARLRCQVVTLYQGGRYSLYRYRRHDDVRLVFAPELSVAAFGGEPDNFNFPRYCLDIAFLRVYDDNAPASTPQHLRLRFGPIEDNEIALMAGSPGRTSRLLSAAELAFERDVSLPWQIAALERARDATLAYAAGGPDQSRIAASTLQTVANSHKGLSGRLHALRDPAGFARIEARERDLQTRVGRNLAAARAVGDAWGEIARAETAHRRLFARYQNLEARAGERSMLFLWARDLVRGAEERGKADAARLPRYTQARLEAVVRNLEAERAIAPAFEALQLEIWLTRLQSDLGQDRALMQRIFNGETPAALAAKLAQSSLADVAVRRALWSGGADAIAGSDDTLIRFARAWDGDARAVRDRFVSDVEAPIALAQERIAQARFRAFGEAHYPDATFSPRLSYGRVEGWIEPDGLRVGAFTQVDGLFARATGEGPYALTPPWHAARPRLDGAIVYNFSSSTDSIGGNSGSPLLDRNGDVIGVVFDGNLHALGGEYFYDGALNRSVAVSAAAIRLALADVYAMQLLLAELER